MGDRPCVLSVLHLVLTGLMCVALLVRRRRAADRYGALGGPLVPAAGAVASFGLVAIVRPLAVGLGGVVVLLGASSRPPRCQ